MDRDNLYIDDEAQDRMGPVDYVQPEDDYGSRERRPGEADLDVADYQADDLEGYGRGGDTRPPARDYDLEESQRRRSLKRHSSKKRGQGRGRRRPEDRKPRDARRRSRKDLDFEDDEDQPVNYEALTRENTRERREMARQSNGKKRPKKQERHEPVVRGAINRWFMRLGDVKENKSFSVGASEYEANQTRSDYLMNTIGASAWGALFPILSVIATQLAGAEEAGMFSMAFTVATLMLYVGNYGVRTYQVSDIDEAESFASYQIHRLITCAAMLAICFVWCAAKGYGADMTMIMWGAFIFRAVDALADAYEGRLQQMDKLYLAGVSVAVRSVVGIIVFTLVQVIMKNLAFASIAMAIAAVLCFLVLTLPLALMETPKSRPFDAIELREIFVDCFPSFASLFLFGLIESMPKFAMEGVLPYEDQIFFSAIYFPAQTILMIVGFVYKPQLVTIANVWNDKSKRHRFDLIVFVMMGVSALATFAIFLFYVWMGVWLNGLMYGVDFEPYRGAQYLMILAGGFSAAIDFLFQTITVLRRQAQATVTYLIAFVFVAIASMILVRMSGFMGAVYSYTTVMIFLFIMLAIQFVLIRLKEH